MSIEEKSRINRLEEQALARQARLDEMEKEAEVRKRFRRLLWTIGSVAGGVILIVAQIVIWWLNSR